MTISATETSLVITGPESRIGSVTITTFLGNVGVLDMSLATNEGLSAIEADTGYTLTLAGFVRTLDAFPESEISFVYNRISRTIRHLLPSGRAWRATIDKPLRQFFAGLGEGLQAFRVNFDAVAEDMYPATTRILSEYEEQFGLYPSTLETQERRDRIAAAWKARGGQSPRYIQDTLQAAGFPVFVHDWWETGTTNARNPFDVLGDSSTSSAFNVVSDGATSYTNNPNAVTGAAGGANGYLLVNLPTTVNYLIPVSSTLWPYIIYVGGEVWGGRATVPSARRDEFETLCLKICPLHLWIGVLVEYS
jgi:uncharacterized protein YmfQ (DUF2313 family)